MSVDTNLGFKPITCLPVDIFTAPANVKERISHYKNEFYFFVDFIDV